MLPQGFLGTRADILIDLIIVSIVLIVPTLAYSFVKARRREYAVHRRIQLTLASVLAVAILLFEIDLRMSGGIVELTRESRYAGTDFLNGSIYFHLIFSVSSAILWTWLTFASLKRFPSPPAPARFSRTHRFWGRVAMIDMTLTGVTGIELYVIGFVL